MWGYTSPWEGVPAKGGVHAWGGVPPHGSVYLQRECTCSGVYLPMGGCIYKGSVHAGGCTFPWEGVPRKGVYMLGGVPPHGRVYLQRECTCWGVYLPMGGCTCQGGCTYWGVYLPTCSPPCGNNFWHTILNLLEIYHRDIETPNNFFLNQLRYDTSI